MHIFETYAPLTADASRAVARACCSSILWRQDLECSPDLAFVVLDPGPFRQPLTQYRQRLSHGGVFRRLLHFAPIGQPGNGYFRLIAGISGGPLSILSSVFLGSSRAAMDGHYSLAGSYIL